MHLSEGLKEDLWRFSSRDVGCRVQICTVAKNRGVGTAKQRRSSNNQIHHRIRESSAKFLMENK